MYIFISKQCYFQSYTFYSHHLIPHKSIFSMPSNHNHIHTQILPFTNIAFPVRSSLNITAFDLRICEVQNRNVVKYKYNSMQDKPRTTNKHNGRWTKDEHLNFLQGLRIYGKNWKKIEQLVPTRTGSQIRSHAQKFFIKNKSNHTIDQQEDTPLSGDLQEYPQEITRNSKSICEASLGRENHSYYFQQIVKYSSASNDLNFWQALVDFKEASEMGVQQSRKNSFQSLHQQQKRVIQDQFSSKIKF